MPGEPAARLYFDAACGPCRLFARASEWASRSRVRAVPYDGPEADRELAGLADEERFAYAHLVRSAGRTSGGEIMTPLVGLTVGTTGERVLERVPQLDRGLRWVYDRFWSYRRRRGCGAEAVPGRP